MDIEQIQANIALFRGMITCNAQIYFWCYDEKGNLLESDCPHESIFFTVFSAFGGVETLYEYGREHTKPLIVGTPIGLNWFGAYQKEAGEIQRVYVFGPIFSNMVSFKGVEQTLRECPELNVSLVWKKEFLQALEQVPTVSSLIVNQYQVMLHYCVTGEKIRTSDVGNRLEAGYMHEREPAEKDRHRVWIAEQALLRAVREGDLNYRDALSNSSNISSGVPVHAMDPLRQAKDSVIVSIALYTRAAIEGGLSPEKGYSLGDAYIQSVEDCRSVADVGSIHNTMLDDFVHRVHKCRTNPTVSKTIRRCCDYIETHTEDKLSIALLAGQVGYTEYYLSRKFKAEMNVGLNDYIKIARVERAKFLLKTTDESIQDLAMRLHFCSRSHFGEVFRKFVGCSPVEYRDKM